MAPTLSIINQFHTNAIVSYKLLIVKVTFTFGPNRIEYFFSVAAARSGPVYGWVRCYLNL